MPTAKQAATTVATVLLALYVLNQFQATRGIVQTALNG